VAWTKSGVRKHPSKFPATVPKDAKAAEAKVINVDPALLESWWIGSGKKWVLMFEVKVGNVH